MQSELARLHDEYGWSPDFVAIRNQETGVWVAKKQEVGVTAYSDETWTDMDPLLDKSWWYGTRNRIILDALRSSRTQSAIWDVGGGSGVVGSFLISSGYEVIGVEPSRSGAEMSSRRGVPSFSAELADLKLPGESLDAVSMFDVLEHIERREAILEEVRRVLKPGGRFLLTLPALNMLWSQFDEDGGHFLRYSRSTIRQELSDHGFEVLRDGYFFLLTVIPLFLIRVIPYRFGILRVANTNTTLSANGGFLGKLAAIIERRIAMYAPIGSSLLVVARKR